MATFPDLQGGLSTNDNRLHSIVFESIELPMKLGIYAQEKLKAQRVTVSVAALVLPPQAAHDDKIENVVDYSKIHSGIMELGSGSPINLQETLAEAVARVCFEQAAVVAVEVHVRKPDAYENCASVGVRIVRTRPR